MQKLIMGTTNLAKINQVKGCLAPLGIEVSGVADKSLLPEVIEDGKTVQENARIKALAYAKALGQRVISMDNALFINGLPDEQQPGIHVRRINGREANSDEEMLTHFQAVISSLGNRVDGYWDFGICVADSNGRFWETTINSPRTFTSARSDKSIEGYPLESIQIDPESGKYLPEMSIDERAQFWQRVIGQELQSFIRTVPPETV